MSWTWRYTDVDGAPTDPPEAPSQEAFPSRSDAETWLGENWRELRHAGVAAVTLTEDGRAVYGPMGLDPA